MKLSLTVDGTTRRRFVLLAPREKLPRGTFRHVESNPGLRHGLMVDMQRLRGRIYLQDGAITDEELTPDGRHIQAIDDQSWHLLIVNQCNRVVGCTRYLQHSASTSFDSLRVRTAALAESAQWSAPLRQAVEGELAEARRSSFSYVEVGGWALDETVRGTSDAVRSVLFTFAWSQVIGGCLGLSVATHRNGSASILRRIGGHPLEWGGCPLPAYYDPQYKCEMEVIRFDSRAPSAKYQSTIEQIKSQIPVMEVISSGTPSRAWPVFVNRLQTSAAALLSWHAEDVAPAA